VAATINQMALPMATRPPTPVSPNQGAALANWLPIEGATMTADGVTSAICTV
jgi:hypothetical protein